MLGTCKENTFTNAGFKKQILFRLGEQERSCNKVDSSRRLLHEQLHRAVGNDGLSVRRGQKVVYVLGNRRDTKEIFTATFDESKHELGGILVLHEPPSLIDDQDALFAF